MNCLSCLCIRNLLLASLALLVVSAGASFAAERDQRIVYLTFDDGPLPGTANILSVLKAENVPAAMFMVGEHVETIEGGRALLAEAKALPLVTIGNHSYSHANNRYRNFYSNTEAVIADMQRADQVLGLNIPVDARLPGRDVFRLPGLAADDLSINAAQWEREWLDYELVSEAGFLLYGWDFEWVHANDGRPVQSVDLLLTEIDHLFRYNRFVRPGRMILLMHDEMFQDRFDGSKNLTALIRGLKARGYNFGRLDEFLAGPDRRRQQ